MKKIFYIYYVVGSLLGLNSCADLDITPASSIDKDEFTGLRKMWKVQ